VYIHVHYSIYVIISLYLKAISCTLMRTCASMHAFPLYKTDPVTFWIVRHCWAVSGAVLSFVVYWVFGAINMCDLPGRGMLQMFRGVMLKFTQDVLNVAGYENVSCSVSVIPFQSHAGIHHYHPVSC
jgi:hypothetical protein